MEPYSFAQPGYEPAIKNPSLLAELTCGNARSKHVALCRSSAVTD